jgi:hypothetical protein
MEDALHRPAAFRIINAPASDMSFQQDKKTLSDFTLQEYARDQGAAMARSDEKTSMLSMRRTAPRN